MVFPVVEFRKNMKPIVTVIIPAFNEAQTIESVIRSVIAWNIRKEILVVNDGSTDATIEKVRHFGSSVRLLTLSQNCGKGSAMVYGIKRSRAPILVFLDGDIVGLRPHDVDELAHPVLAKKADMVIGLHNFWHIGSFYPYNALSGQRVVRKHYLIAYLEPMKQARGGVEFIINKALERHRVVFVTQSHVRTVRKIDKWPFLFACKFYMCQFFDFMRESTFQFLGIGIYSKVC
ncbi:MAG: hypothetical protein UV17_C0054G0002 [Candidatus Gottesmanbacteria bacterium GW2011_GWA1_42_26]|uniref:Glycosyltransferase 2-like domain-containing protein n=2 Tax=Candidatus Gottesmaniibacteriota TaxID=1752720 RepID=A0A0G1IRZ1_9BACT|nr:MAG: hypothetical protein UV17_C0054G0002 [Candidatus Gottesmanbacteria bacterium GW2011_GWA1_42_26]KKT34557.1 MAG: hypothetical protein UW22_C0071G0003 [Candidatus Gottesmanbacteria bacterium GW2011_GWB1_44_11c]